MPRRRSAEPLLQLLQSHPVVDLPAIRSALGSVSVMTAFRYLRQVPYRRSYNHNGRYYTLHDPSRYDRFGLCSSGNIHFSVDGSLRNTVRRLVHEAAAGATHRELQDRLRLRVHNTLADLVRDGEVDRERLVEVYVYFHTDPIVRGEQVQRRQELMAASAAEAEAEVTDAVIIEVLLTLLRHPGAKAVDVMRRLHGHSPPITTGQVRNVYQRYDLDNLEEKGGFSNC